MDRVREEVGLERLHAAAAVNAGDLPTIDEQQLEKVRASYSYLRRAMHAVLDTVVLRGATSIDDELLATLKRLRDARDRFVDEPVALLPKAWRAWVLDDDGRAQRTPLSSGCGSSRVTRCAPGACIGPSGVATPTPPGSSCPRALAGSSRRARGDVRPHAGSADAPGAH
jgi:hypothetical protein